MFMFYGLLICFISIMELVKYSTSFLRSENISYFNMCSSYSKILLIHFSMNLLLKSYEKGNFLSGKINFNFFDTF
jgi:hypothetical protein